MSQILIKSLDEIEKVRKACKIVAKTLATAGKKIKAGISTSDLDKIAEELIRKEGAEPVFIGYRGYRHATCISVNEEIVHGIPGEKVLQEGDIVSLDVGAKIDGYCGDSAATFPVGRISRTSAKLMRSCKTALKAAIKQARAGNHLGDISAAVESVANKTGYSVVRDLYGHGIGKDLHEEPLIPNYGNPGEGPKLKPGMILAIEPMFNIGTWRIKTLDDGWTVITADRSRSCHFEHTVLITEGEPEVLTLRGNQ